MGIFVGIWKGHEKDQAESLDDRGVVGYLLDIDIWQNHAGWHRGQRLSS